MADIVNLRTARKRKRRAEAEASASESRVRHGVSQAEKAQASRDRGLRDTRLDGHLRVAEAADEPGDPAP